MLLTRKGGKTIFGDLRKMVAVPVLSTFEGDFSSNYLNCMKKMTQTPVSTTLADKPIIKGESDPFQTLDPTRSSDRLYGARAAPDYLCDSSRIMADL